MLFDYNAWLRRGSVGVFTMHDVGLDAGMMVVMMMVPGRHELTSAVG